ncbi:unnamed protein product, partial [Meganyctiphanes norvegica]
MSQTYAANCDEDAALSQLNTFQRIVMKATTNHTVVSILRIIACGSSREYSPHNQGVILLCRVAHNIGYCTTAAVLRPKHAHIAWCMCSCGLVGYRLQGIWQQRPVAGPYIACVIVANEERLKDILSWPKSTPRVEKIRETVSNKKTCPPLSSRIIMTVIEVLVVNNNNITGPLRGPGFIISTIMINRLMAGNTRSGLKGPSSVRYLQRGLRTSQSHLAGPKSQQDSKRLSSTPPDIDYDILRISSGLQAFADPLAQHGSGGSGLFARRLDFSSFNALPRTKINSYHIKMEDDGLHGNDDTRCFILSTLAAVRSSRTACVLCNQALLVFDRYPLIDGTFFLTPLQHGKAAIPVRVEGRLQHLTAVCMGCLEGWCVSLRCSFCNTRWDGSSLILGTCYSFDIFAAMPCCEHRLKCQQGGITVSQLGSRLA